MPTAEVNFRYPSNCALSEYNEVCFLLSRQEVKMIVAERIFKYLQVAIGSPMNEQFRFKLEKECQELFCPTGLSVKVILEDREVKFDIMGEYDAN